MMINKKGFTIVELMVAVAISALIIGGIFGVLTVGRQSWDVGNTEVDLQQETRRAMDWMVRELRQSGKSYVLEDPDDPDETITETISLNDGDSADTITFRISEGWDSDNGRIDWGEKIKYELRGDGHITRAYGDPAPPPSTLAVDVTSLSFTRSSSNVIEISLQAEKDSVRGRRMQSTLDSQVTLRNQ